MGAIPSLPESGYQIRLSVVRDHIADVAVDTGVWYGARSIVYLTHFYHAQTERPVVLVVTDDRVEITVPKLERICVEKNPHIVTSRRRTGWTDPLEQVRRRTRYHVRGVEMVPACSQVSRRPDGTRRRTGPRESGGIDGSPPRDVRRTRGAIGSQDGHPLRGVDPYRNARAELHPYPTNRPLREREVIVITAEANVDGYFSEIESTKFIGEPSAEQRRSSTACSRRSRRLSRSLLTAFGKIVALAPSHRSLTHTHPSLYVTPQ